MSAAIAEEIWMPSSLLKHRRTESFFIVLFYLFSKRSVPEPRASVPCGTPAWVPTSQRNVKLNYFLLYLWKQNRVIVFQGYLQTITISIPLQDTMCQTLIRDPYSSDLWCLSILKIFPLIKILGNVFQVSLLCFIACFSTFLCPAAM